MKGEVFELLLEFHSITARGRRRKDADKVEKYAKQVLVDMQKRLPGIGSEMRLQVDHLVDALKQHRQTLRCIVGVNSGLVEYKKHCASKVKPCVFEAVEIAIKGESVNGACRMTGAHNNSVSSIIRRVNRWVSYAEELAEMENV